MTKVELDRATLTEAVLTVVTLIKASLSRADLTGADLSGAILLQADLSRADLRGVKLDGADMTRTRFAMAIIEGVDLSTVKGLKDRQLSRACGNAETKLPAGIKMPETWPCKSIEEREGEEAGD
jgi:uncharacterized protein YjbI with pentapeptide repeats